MIVSLNAAAGRVNVKGNDRRRPNRSELRLDRRKAHRVVILKAVRLTTSRNRTWTPPSRRAAPRTFVRRRVFSSRSSSGVVISGRPKPPHANAGITRREFVAAIWPPAVPGGKNALWLLNRKSKSSNSNSNAPKPIALRHRRNSPSSRTTKKKPDCPRGSLASPARWPVFLLSRLAVHRSLP
jgi:hypothetical protein